MENEILIQTDRDLGIRLMEEKTLLEELRNRGSMSLSDLEDYEDGHSLDSGRSASGILRELGEAGKGFVIERRGVFYTNDNLLANLRRHIHYVLIEAETTQDEEIGRAHV